MTKRFICVFLLIALVIGNLSAQKGKNVTTSNKSTTTVTTANKKGHEILFNIKNAQDKIVYLVIHYNEKLILKDSVTPYAPGKYLFKGENSYDDGMYSLVSEKKQLYLNFIIDNNQFFEYNLDTTGNVDNFSVKNTPENEEMLKFQRKTSIAQKSASEWSKKVKEFDDAQNTDSAEYYKNKLSGLNDDMMDFINQLIERNPNYLFSKMQKSYLSIDVPEFKNEDGSIDYVTGAAYYRTHYWDNFDLADHRFIYIPSFEPKLKEYFTKIIYHQEADTINKYVDMFLAKTEPDTFMFHYCVDWLSYQFETSKVIGHDAVFYHIATNNQLAGKCYWLDEDILAKYEKRCKRLRPTLIGQVAPELLIPDTTLTDDVRLWKSSYRTGKPYTILWFFDPNCPTCKKESIALRHVYDSLERAGTRNFEVYAIGNDDTIEAWKKYVKDNNHPWINVGGNKGNLDYLEHFGIYETGNPAMFIINPQHKIILNRRIDMNNIPQFLEEYEKAEQKRG